MLADAVAFGLPEAVALRAVDSVICGSAGLMAGKLDGVPGLLESYMSYKGITAAGLTAAEAAGFEGAVKAALAAAFTKAKEMSVL